MWNTHKVEPGGFTGNVAPTNLVNGNGHTVPVGELSGSRQTMSRKHEGASRLLKDSPKAPDLSNRYGGGIMLSTLVQVPQFRPRSTRRIRDHRVRPRIEPGIPLLIPPVSDELWIWPSRVHVEH